MTDLIFLKALRDKLKGGNIRSIHLNALPGRFATRLDLANLNYIRPDFATQFINQLLTQSCFDFKISFDGIDFNSIQTDEQKRLGLLSKRLNSINIENEDNYKEHGIKTFGFGFPILIKQSKQDPKKIIKAPLFIWQLEILKSVNKLNTWSILRNKTLNENGRIIDQEIHSVGLNEVLLSFLKNEENLIIPQINDELLEDAIINKQELIEECYKVLKALNANTTPQIQDSLNRKFNEPLVNIPESGVLESTSGNLPWIHFGGVFGLFRTQKESIITDIDKLIEKFDKFEFENLGFENFSGTAYSAVETDPSQQEILTTLGISPKKIIQGPPGTGKSQSLTALITNALANNLKCLVVCEKKTALDVIKNNLHKQSDQLGLLAAVVEDINKDRDGIVNSVRDRLGNFSENLYFNQTKYNNIIKIVEEKSAELNQQHKELDKKVYQGKSWTELVGEFLKRQKKVDISELRTKLDYKLFKFQDDENELSEIISKIKIGKRIYKEINRLDHPLEILNDAIFKQEVPRAIQLRLEEIGKELIESLKNVITKLQNELSEYKNWIDEFYKDAIGQLEQLSEIINTDVIEYQNWLDKHYEDYYHELKLNIVGYKDFANSNHAKFGDLFYKNDGFSNFKINTLSILSNRYKELKANRYKLIEKISQIKEVHQKYNYFEHRYIDEFHFTSLKIYVDNIYDFGITVDEWYVKNSRIKDEYVKKMSSKTLHSGYSDNIGKVIDTENKFEAFRAYISNDQQINSSFNSTSNHTSKISLLKSLSLQLTDLEKIRNFYINNLSSNQVHYYNAKFINTLKETETLFEQILSIINSGPILKRSLPFSYNHIQKISVSNILYTQILSISQNLEPFREYYDWRRFLIELSPLQQTVIKSLIEINCDNWELTFESWYYYWILAIAESSLKYLPKGDEKIQEFVDSNEQLKTNQIKSIISNWSSRQQQSAKNSHAKGLNPISLFNKRGSRGERRNSLRKIIQTDFQLFTDFFPVVMLSPTVCSSIIPLEEAIFDVVIFDEASQLRLEDTYPSLLRGKIKIVSGDSQQMPPSNFFQGGTALLNPTDEDYEEEQSAHEIHSANRKVNNSLDLADSESLLVYAENCNYKQSYLKVHYRSHHPYLIDFSNHAFYGKRLIPMPAKKEYKPIQFIEVNGLYEDQVNRDEARQVVDILLNHIKPFKTGEYPSVGIATFNLYQRNLILEEITKVRQQNPEHDKKIADLGSDLFVKNLENIQGDERDIIIISTTFGKRSDGTFRQHFGPIVQGKGYKLLNVIITRAKYKVYVCCSIPQESIKQYSTLLHQSKNTGRGIFYAYLAYAKAVSDGNSEIRDALLTLLYDNCEFKSFVVDDIYGSESPFEDEVYYRIAERIGQERLQQQYKIGGFRIDLVVKSKINNMPIVAIECDGAKYHSSNEAYAWDMFRQKRLEEQGFTFYRIWSTNWWHSAEKELQKLVSFIYEFDRQEKQQEVEILDEVFKVGEIIPITLHPEVKRKVTFDSVVSVKSPEGRILKVKFTKTQATQNVKPDNTGIITIYEKAPLALAILGRSEGESCQLGMLELYYEILMVE